MGIGVTGEVGVTLLALDPCNPQKTHGDRSHGRIVEIDLIADPDKLRGLDVG